MRKRQLSHGDIKASISGVIPFIEERNYSEKETSEIVGLSVKTLQSWRFHSKIDLPWLKLGRRVMYFGPDIRDFIDRCRVGSSV